MALSERQKEILEAIRRSVELHGYPPTVREICTAAGISSTSVVIYNLRRLEEQGYLQRNPETSRGIRLLDPAEQQPQSNPALVEVPILGRIAAGTPLPIPDSEFPIFAEESIALTRDILPDEEEIYALEVRGNSMIDALINDGDIVIMRHQTVADNGDLVAVWLKEERETTLKRFFHEGNRIRLQPANPSMEPIFVHPSNVEVQGKVVLVIRQPGRRVLARTAS
ncbi:MAG: transcriptional repressor LexA [Anaerolineae bacterium]